VRNSIKTNKQLVIIQRMFFILLAFNILLQIEVAEDFFNSLFSKIEITENDTPLCGNQHRFASRTNDDGFVIEAQVNGFCTGTEKSKNYAAHVSLLCSQTHSSCLLSYVYLGTYISKPSTRYSGLSPPIT
jgi:hypothetical protein